MGEMLNVGDVMMATSPSGKMLVVGTDISPTVLTAALAERLPFWKRTVDVVVLSEDSPAAWRGLEAIASQYQVEVLITEGGLISELPVGVTRVVEAVDGSRLDLGDETVLKILPHTADNRSRNRLVPFTLAFGLTGVEFPASDSTAISSTPRGWLTVVRDSSSAANARGLATTRIRWDKSADRSTMNGGVDLIPRNDGPISFKSDGQRLTVNWIGCEASNSVCSLVIGDEQPIAEKAVDLVESDR